MTGHQLYAFLFLFLIKFAFVPPWEMNAGSLEHAGDGDEKKQDTLHDKWLPWCGVAVAPSGQAPGRWGPLAGGVSGHGRRSAGGAPGVSGRAVWAPGLAPGGERSQGSGRSAGGGVTVPTSAGGARAGAALNVALRTTSHQRRPCGGERGARQKVRSSVGNWFRDLTGFVMGPPAAGKSVDLGKFVAKPLLCCAGWSREMKITRLCEFSLSE